MRLAFWLVVDLVIGILMLVFGDAKTQYAGLGIIGITLVVVVVIGVIGAVAGVGWGLESLFPHSGWRLEALAADLFLLGVLSLGLANLGVPSWNPILMAYVVVQVPLLVFGRTAGEFVAGVSVVHGRSEPRGLVGTLLEEAVLRLALLQAVLVLAVWALRRLPGFETRWIEISTRHRIVGVTHSRARGLAAILALGLIGVGACSMSLAPATMADSANLNRAQACIGEKSTNPPTCLVEVPATVLDVHDDITRDKDGNILDSIYYVQVSIHGQPQSLQADTTLGTRVLDRLHAGEDVTAGLWGGALVLVRSDDGDVWADGSRPGESSGPWVLWLGLGMALIGFVLVAVLNMRRVQ